MSTSRDITISGQTFAVTVPFEEGHVCTVAEAKALNQTRCENIRNNMAKRVKEKHDDEGNVTEADMTALTEAVTEYDKEYVFTLANVGGSRQALDPVEKEARKIARELIADALKSNDRKISEIDKEKLAEAIAAKAAQEPVIKLAKKRIADRKKNAEDALDGLGI